MQPYRDFFIYSAEALALGANAETTQRINIEGDADFEAMLQVASAISRNFRVRQLEASTGRQLHDASLSGAGAFGNGRNPFRLPVVARFKRASSFLNTIRDESGAPNQIRLAYIGAKVFKRWPFPPPVYQARIPFTYTATFVPTATDPDGIGAIAAGQTGIFNIRTQDDADFEIRKLTIVHDIAIPAASDSVATIQLTDVTYNYRFMDRPIPVESLGGAQITAGVPPGFFAFILPVPKLLRRGSVLSVTIQNLDGASPLQVRVSFYGSKCYTSRPMDAAAE